MYRKNEAPKQRDRLDTNYPNINYKKLESDSHIDNIIITNYNILHGMGAKLRNRNIVILQVPMVNEH